MDDKLVIKRVGREAAEYAVINWHYSKAMPAGRLISYGVWEHGKFVGAIIFGRGASRWLMNPYGLKQREGCELVRVALRVHEFPVSQMVAMALKDLRLANPGLRLVISFADPGYGHHGGIYQAGGWFYTGLSVGTPLYLIKGKITHIRSVGELYKNRRGTVRGPRDKEKYIDWVNRTIDPQAVKILPMDKYRYVMPLDRQMRRLLLPQVLDYPQKCGQSIDGNTSGFHSEGAGSTPAGRSNV